MRQKNIFVIAMVVMLSLAGIVQAVTIWGAASGDWGSLSSWRDPKQIPVAGDQAIPFNGQIVDVTNAQGCGTLNIGYVYNATVNVAASGNLTVTTLHVGQTAEGNLEVGTMNVNGIVTAQTLYVANERANGRGVLNVYNSGLLTVNGVFNVSNSGTNLPGAGGTINLKGGILVGESGLGVVINQQGHIDIEAGTLKLKGDQRSQIQGYINNGWITSHNGSPHCSPVVSYLDGYTYVKTTGCTCTTYLPADLNHDCYVDMLDLASLAQHWLTCTVPTDSNCVQ